MNVKVLVNTSQSASVLSLERFVRRWSYRTTLPPKPLMVTMPHSGEEIPPEADWLRRWPETILMYDVDRYIDQLYEPVLASRGIPTVWTPYHRYACDLNRLATDVDAASVVGSENPRGAYPRGLHWSMTTDGFPLISAPITQERHQAILRRCFDPFHVAVNQVGTSARLSAKSEVLFHLDLHSMPSFGTREHRDPGQWRSDMVISNQDGKSSSIEFFELVCRAAETQGFAVSRNWPYKGGRITEMYGKPETGWQTIQVELNRRLYMNERTKKIVPGLFSETQTRLSAFIEQIERGLSPVACGAV